MFLAEGLTFFSHHLIIIRANVDRSRARYTERKIAAQEQWSSIPSVNPGQRGMGWFMERKNNSLKKFSVVFFICLSVFVGLGCSMSADAGPGGARMNFSGPNGSGGFSAGPGGFKGGISGPNGNISINAGKNGFSGSVNTRDGRMAMYQNPRGGRLQMNTKNGNVDMALPPIDVNQMRQQSPGYPYGQEETLSNKQLLTYINEARNQKGLPPVSLDDQLVQQARRRSEEIAQLPSSGWQQNDQMQALPIGGGNEDAKTYDAKFLYRGNSPVDVPGVGERLAKDPNELAKVFFDGYAVKEDSKLFNPSLKRVGINTTIVGDQQYAANTVCFPMD